MQNTITAKLEAAGLTVQPATLKTRQPDGTYRTWSHGLTVTRRDRLPHVTTIYVNNSAA